MSEIQTPKFEIGQMVRKGAGDKPWWIVAINDYGFSAGYSLASAEGGKGGVFYTERELSDYVTADGVARSAGQVGR